MDSEEKEWTDNVFVVAARPLYCLVVDTAIENLQTNITGNWTVWKFNFKFK